MTRKVVALETWYKLTEERSRANLGGGWGVGEGGKLMQIRQEYLFSILKFTHQGIFRQRIRVRVNCGRELKRSVLCLAPDAI